jgi:hypothetical protein
MFHSALFKYVVFEDERGKDGGVKAALISFAFLIRSCQGGIA